jgi:hypothetical protein
MINSQSFPNLTPNSLDSSVVHIVNLQVFKDKCFLEILSIQQVLGGNFFDCEVIHETQFNLFFDGSDIQFMNAGSLLYFFLDCNPLDAFEVLDQSLMQQDLQCLFLLDMWKLDDFL